VLCIHSAVHPPVERVFVERLYDVYQHPPTLVETRSNRCLIFVLEFPRLAVHRKRTTNH